MGTHSRIGILNANGTVLAVYCHYDGGLSLNGKILLEHYHSEEKIRDLFKQGNLIYLRQNIGGKHNHIRTCNPEWCCFYIRDEEEDREENLFQLYSCVHDLLIERTEFTYIFNPITRQWFWTTTWNEGFEPLKRLTMKDCLT